MLKQVGVDDLPALVAGLLKNCVGDELEPLVFVHEALSVGVERQPRGALEAGVAGNVQV